MGAHHYHLVSSILEKGLDLQGSGDLQIILIKKTPETKAP